MLKKIIGLALAIIVGLSFASCDKEDEPYGSGSSSSSAKVAVSNISIGSKDKRGRYSVKITIKASGLASDESVKTIGAKWGTVKGNPNYRDSRSSGTSVIFTSAWHSGQTYYVTPFLRTNKTYGEITGKTKSKKTP